MRHGDFPGLFAAFLLHCPSRGSCACWGETLKWSESRLSGEGTQSLADLKDTSTSSTIDCDERWGASMFQERHDKYWHSKPAVKHSKYHTTELLGLNGFRWFRSCAMESHSSCVPRLLLPKVLRRHGIDIGKIWARCSTEVGRLLWWFTKTLGWDAPPPSHRCFIFGTDPRQPSFDCHCYILLLGGGTCQTLFYSSNVGSIQPGILFMPEADRHAAKRSTQRQPHAAATLRTDVVFHFRILNHKGTVP